MTNNGKKNNRSKALTVLSDNLDDLLVDLERDRNVATSLMDSAYDKAIAAVKELKTLRRLTRTTVDAAQTMLRVAGGQFANFNDGGNKTFDFGMVATATDAARNLVDSAAAELDALEAKRKPAISDADAAKAEAVLRETLTPSENKDGD